MKFKGIHIKNPGVIPKLKKTTTPTFTRPSVDLENNIEPNNPLFDANGINIRRLNINMASRNQQGGGDYSQNTDGFVAIKAGDTISYDPSQHNDGAGSIKCVTGNASTYEGVYISASGGRIGESYNGGAWVWGTGTVVAYVKEGSKSSGAESTRITLTETPEYIQAPSRTFGTSTDVRLYITTGGVKQQATIYADTFDITGPTMEYLTIPATVLDNIQGNTIECIIDFTDSHRTGTTIFYEWYYNATNLVRLYSNGTNLVLQFKGHGVTGEKCKIPLTSISNGIHKVGVTFDLNIANLYVDGIGDVIGPRTEYSRYMPPVPYTTQTTFSIGSSTVQTSQINSSIKELTISNYRRPPSEMAKRGDITKPYFELDSNVVYHSPLGSNLVTYKTGSKRRDLYKTRPAPCVVFTFDDGYASQYTAAAPYLESNGIPGTYFIVPDWLGTNNLDGTPYMNLTQLRDLQESYDSLICNHTKTHYDLTDTQSPGTNITDGKNWLIANGFSEGANYLAYPGGAFNQTVLDACADIAVGAARAGLNVYDLDPSLHKYFIPALQVVYADTASSILTKITNAITNGRSIVLLFHRLVEEDSTTYNVKPSVFEDIVDGIVAAGYPCKNFKDYVEGY